MNEREAVSGRGGGDERGISTVVDVVLFLLLVSAALVTVTLPGGGSGALGAGESARLLATTTASVEYELVAESADGEATRRRVAHGTLAGLAARAAVADATVAGRPLSPASESFVRATRERIRERLGPRTQVHARWRPYGSSPIRGTVTIGPQPPPTADVSGTVLRVPVGSTIGQTGPPRDYGRVSGAVAEGLTAQLLPETSAEVPRVDGPVRRDVRRRYRLLAGDRAGRVTELFETGNVSAATALTSEAIEERIGADLRREFDTPAGAARDVEVGTATVTVRRWDR